MTFTNSQYDVLKFIGTVVLPALSILCATLAEIWGLPEVFTKQIPLTITALDLVLNSLLGISTANYYKDMAVRNNYDTNDESIG